MATQSSDLLSIRVIKPLKEPSKNLETVGRVFYPYQVFELKILLRRLLLKSRELRILVVVDRARARAYTIDTIPETYEELVDPQFVVKPRITEEEAARLARKFAAYYVLRYWKVVKPPDITVERSIEMYKIYWIVKQKGELYIMDSI